MKDTPFYKQAELLLEVLPIVAKHKVFALKGGTAINFFVRACSEARLNIDSKAWKGVSVGATANETKGIIE